MLLASESGRRHAFSFGVALTAFATIALELLLTRIYSVTMYYHFAFMVISLALLGLAIAGVTTYLLPRVFKLTRVAELASGFTLLFAIGAVIALEVSVTSPIRLKVPMSESLPTLLLLYFAAALPFLMSGFALTLAISSAGERINRIYAFDLIGAAAGCLFVIPAISRLGGPGAILMVAAVGGVGAALFALSGTGKLRLPLAGAGAVVALVLAILGVTELGARRFAIRTNPDKFLAGHKVLYEKWNAFSQITVGNAGRGDHRWIFIDQDAATRMWSGDIAPGYTAPLDFAEVRVAALVYSLRHAGPALIIGPGGGTDVISALRAGVPRVVGVEVNPIIAEDVMRGTFAGWNGDLYNDPRVHVVVDEGRSYIRRSGEAYSSIQATLVDTWAASSSGAFTLSENNIYTVEAFEEFLDHLQPGGVLAVTRWYDSKQPKEFLRLIGLGRAALESRGVKDVSRHFLLAEDRGQRGTLLLSRDPFTDEDLAAAKARAAQDKLRLLYVPGAETNDKFLGSFLTAPSASDFFAELPYDATPTTDDKPFFFYTVRPGELFSLLGQLDSLERNNLGLAILLILLLVSTALTLLFVVLPLLLFRRDALKVDRGPKLRVLAFFLCLGLGFILVEIGFMQRFVLFLGHPIYALAVVLATLLAASGTGSALSGGLAARWGARGLARRAIAVLAVLMIIYALVLGPVFHALLGLPLGGRIVIAALLVAVPGLLMGALLPTGVRAANALGPEVVPWAWGLNGATSVVGSILAITLSMNYGFTATLYVGVGAYLLGMLALPETQRN